MNKFLLSLLAVLVAQDSPITRQDIVKMTLSGSSDDAIIARIDKDKPVFDLKAGDIVDLKGLGVSERVIARMLATMPAPAASPVPTTPPQAADANAVVKNDCFRALCVSVDEKEKTFGVSRNSGSEIKVGATFSWKLAEGTWTIAIEGSPTIDRFEVGGGKPVKLTLNGANLDTLEIITLITEDRKGRLVSIIDSVGKLAESQARRDPKINPPDRYVGMYGPKFVYLPHVANNVLVGAGVGAILGRRSGHAAQGAAIGAAAALLMDHSPWYVVRWR